jgi:hypothetical protein
LPLQDSHLDVVHLSPCPNRRGIRRRARGTTCTHGR